MKKKLNVIESATAICKAVQSNMHAMNDTGILIRESVTLFELPALGEEIGKAWKKLGEKRPPMRVLATACFEANLSRREASSLLNSTGLVSHVAVIGALTSAGFPEDGKKKPTVKAKSSLDKAIKYIESLELNKSDLKALIAKLSAM